MGRGGHGLTLTTSQLSHCLSEPDAVDIMSEPQLFFQHFITVAVTHLGLQMDQGLRKQVKLHHRIALLILSHGFLLADIVFLKEKLIPGQWF